MYSSSTVLKLEDEFSDSYFTYSMPAQFCSTIPFVLRTSYIALQQSIIIACVWWKKNCTKRAIKQLSYTWLHTHVQKSKLCLFPILLLLCWMGTIFLTTKSCIQSRVCAWVRIKGRGWWWWSSKQPSSSLSSFGDLFPCCLRRRRDLLWFSFQGSSLPFPPLPFYFWAGGTRYWYVPKSCVSIWKDIKKKIVHQRVFFFAHVAIRYVLRTSNLDFYQIIDVVLHLLHLKFFFLLFFFSIECQCTFWWWYFAWKSIATKMTNMWRMIWNAKNCYFPFSYVLHQWSWNTIV